MRSVLTALLVPVFGFALGMPFSVYAQAGTTDAAPAATTAGKSEAKPAAPTAAGGGVDKGRKKRGRLSDELARQGEAELRKSVRVFQQRYLLKAGRAELQVGGSMTMADPLVSHRNLDAGLLWHINEEWAVGATGSKPYAEFTEAFVAIQNDFGLFPEKSEIQGMGFGEVQWSPIFGKFSTFGVAVVQMDAYLLAGGGALRTTINSDYKPAGQIGAGLRIHLLRALTLSLEIRDVLFVESFKLGDHLMQHVFGGVRLGFWIPPTVQYRFQR
jgi:outer membrane beta-barrel protein